MSQLEEDRDRYYTERCDNCGYPFFACECADTYNDETRDMEELADAERCKTDSESDSQIPF